MYLFEVKEYISKNLVKIRPSVLNKMAGVLHQLKAPGRFVATPTFLYIFMFLECHVEY